ncbi:MAG: glutamine-hydrolyzing carbamoyl-phosphate synthase small subunit [Schleiferiaceae bacterium]|nr:glutamine-hydrolyzing carbamoyl-phosphate synthase small subunit [Schleiferiaceae bacterium]
MNNTPSKSATLLLQDGARFYGSSVGLDGITGGELCFNTGMTGYQEIFTDPSYYGQLMVMATSHIGNYGVHADEVESDSIKVAGLITKSFSPYYSRAGQQTGSLYDYFKASNKIAATDFDTRAIVQYIRDNGAMNAVVAVGDYTLEEMQAHLDALPNMKGLELASKVSTKEPYFYGDENAPFHVTALDFGIKTNILRNLAQRGCRIQVFPHDTPFDVLAATNPHGFFLSNGPGDPQSMQPQIDVVQQIIHSGKPVFGICLGHQLIALANGLPTFKMHNGHRGINHPIKNLETGKSEITSQNHGFVVDKAALEAHPELMLTHIHLNDNTAAGLRMINRPVFSVQYHPEAGPGPNDATYLFDQFLTNMNQLN